MEIDNVYEHLLWRETARELEARCRIFDVYSVQKSHPSGKSGRFYLVDAPEWVTIVPLMIDEEGRRNFIMVRQYRHGSGKVTLEFPAGVVERGEDPETAGIRELKEETGYAPSSSRFLGNVNPNPAFMNNHTHVYVMTGLEKKHPQSFDEHEEVEVEIIPEKEVLEKMGTGEYGNGIMMIALGFYIRWKEYHISGNSGS